MFRTLTPQVDSISPGEALALLSGRGSWRQYPSYAQEAAERVASASRHLVVSDGGEPIALANLRVRALPMGLGAAGLISHGPVLLRPRASWQDDLGHALSALADHARTTGQEIRIDPDPMWQVHGLEPDLPAGCSADPNAAPYRTIVMPIGDGRDAVRRRLHGKWRNTLKQAEKADLRIKVSGDPADFARMEPLLDDLIARKGFSINQNPGFFARVAARASGDERVLITLVSAGDAVVSAHIGAYSGEMACYLLGATSARGRELRAAYAAQWAAIGTAIDLGLQWYDLGGINPVANPDVYHFKKRMGGEELTGGRTLVLPPSGWRVYSTRAARAAWQGLSRLRSR